MELLKQLEQRVLTLLDAQDTLKKESDVLKAHQAEALRELKEENALLRQLLDEEQQRNAEALQRVENIIERIKEHAERA